MSERVLTTDVLAGEAAPLTELGGAEVGLWEMAPGTDHDTEVDEVFVVLAGRGTVDLRGRRGDRPRARRRRPAARGRATTWVVTETLRKVYVAV